MKAFCRRVCRNIDFQQLNGCSAVVGVAIVLQCKETSFDVEASVVNLKIIAALSLAEPTPNYFVD